MKKFFWRFIIVGNCFTSLQATTVTVPSGTTQTSPITLLNPGDSVVVEENGVLETDDPAITMSNSSQTALNQGTIRTINTNHFGIRNTGVNAVITNNGLITTTGQQASGIYNSGANSLITNSGQISIAGNSAAGITNDHDDVVMTSSGQISITGAASDGLANLSGSNVVMTNSGQISVTGDFGNGLLNFNGSNVVMTNSGLISTTGSGVWGVSSNGDNGVITNSGQISTTGQQAYGIGTYNVANNTLIINTGSISATGVSAHGISDAFGGDNSHVINSGTIYSAQSFALYLTGDNNILTLLRGSNLQGPVRVGSNFTLNVERGLNLALTLNLGSFDNVEISAPYAIKNNVIAVIDRTGLALQADVAADLSDTIFGALDHHRLTCCTPCSCGPWIQGIGSYRKRDSHSHTVEYKNWQGGFLLGYGLKGLAGNISLFGGATFGKAKTDKSTQEADINSYIGGVSYEKIYCDTQLNVGVAAGYVDWDNERTVMNNLATGGKQKARADINGWLLSPEISILHRFNVLCRPTLGLTVRYAGLFFRGLS